ncbi:Zn-ribbon domain-containing OB-fold protein [Nocardia testacea]|uniref:Zn-ribbon domain-containing OB-fold protein n=1 Tax=Nocardia testacea TaxID=248551 RepID=UPI0002F67481|nr:OB-fold domain-containing protein [Nocardia testacea]
MYPSAPKHTGTGGDAGAPLLEDTLLIRRCARCDRLYAPLTVDCASCAADSLEWVPSSGAGSILSWRVVDRGVIGGRGETMPLTVAVVELDEGPWVYTSIEGNIPLVAAGPVRVRFRPRPRDGRFPVFTVDTETGTPGPRAADRSGGEHART